MEVSNVRVAGVQRKERACKCNSNGAVYQAEEQNSRPEILMYLAHNGRPLLPLENAMVQESENPLREHGKKQEYSNDLMRGIEVLALIELHGYHNAASERHEEEDCSDSVDNPVAHDLVPNTQEQRAEWDQQDEDEAHHQSMDV